ncbi:TetR/AcrR family transcriptional regulator C-terminal ligand-binding domain-containing protein [Actinomadura madurae]|uniref:TetR/AcrR family transcriptional regulator C-terminal ligand-binding domain-containing protein n=1 Tax=Actinomadura madurae TaxID=1993 RepID=UPI0020D1FEFB|nr:TetR/AcrR family transcriptional regulator C-terminal ligand-binding domain-containing protein [Actinomadura madurae]MCP9954766.1 TetR/AcrR family transcriptional regulator C-terminal ligand-binding domain-containing protein [Actinomadura madurae]
MAQQGGADRARARRRQGAAARAVRPVRPGGPHRDRPPARRRRHSRYSRCFWNVTGSAEKYPDLYARYQQDVIEPRREVIRRVIRNGIETGELRADLDVEVVLSLLLGSLTARRPRETVPAGYAEAAVDTLLRGIGTGPR